MASNVVVTFTDNSPAVLQLTEQKKQLFLELAGQQAEGNTINNINAVGRVKRGRYKNSITHTVSGDTCYIGSNLNYAMYNELGTGKFATDGNGRPGWWVYVIKENSNNSDDDNNNNSHPQSTTRTIYTYEQAARIMKYLRDQGLDAHMTQGIKPTHALRDAVCNHIQEYEDILKLVMQA